MLDRALIDFIRALRGRYTTAIISNYMDELPHLLTHVHAVADAFDLIVVSAQERIMKPDAEIFQRTLSRLNLRPEETVFIDDCPQRRRRAGGGDEGDPLYAGDRMEGGVGGGGG
ncbi:MAG: HAD-IA family hydrolase [Caldilineaceae bacterium]